MRKNWVSSVLARPVGVVGLSSIKGSVRSKTSGVSAATAQQEAASFRVALSRVNSIGAKTAAVGVQRPKPRVAPSGAANAEAYDGLIRTAATREGVDEDLVKALVEAESGFNPLAVSAAGAKGLMQLMDGTARSLGVKDSFDPAANVAGGVKYLRSMLDRFGSIPLALAAYNAGPGTVEKYGGIPPYRETMSYVDKVMQLRERYEASAAKTATGGANGGRVVA